MAVDPNDLRIAHGRCKVTDVSEVERRYLMDVSLSLSMAHGYVVTPWVRITANLETEEICLAADMGVRRIGYLKDEDDGA